MSAAFLLLAYDYDIAYTPTRRRTSILLPFPTHEDAIGNPLEPFEELDP